MASERPQRLDLLGQAVGAVGRIDQGQQGVTELDLEIVDLERTPRSAPRPAAPWRRRSRPAAVWVETTALARRSITKAIAQAPPPRQMNGSHRDAGRNDHHIMTVPDMTSAVG